VKEYLLVRVGNRTYRAINEQQVGFIRRHYRDKLIEIGRAISVNERRVGEIIRSLGLPRRRHWKIYLPYSTEVEADLRNPYLSHAELARKYGVSDTCVAMRRKKLGLRVRRKNYGSIPEQRLARILDELGLAFKTQVRIGRWSIDFFLGCGVCIDMHGSWSHSSYEKQLRDARKAAWLHENEYVYLIVREAQLEDPDEIKRRLIALTAEFPRDRARQPQIDSSKVMPSNFWLPPNSV
jgi:very-short-patch-repair endonuclease